MFHWSTVLLTVCVQQMILKCKLSLVEHMKLKKEVTVYYWRAILHMAQVEQTTLAGATETFVMCRGQYDWGKVV